MAGSDPDQYGKNIALEVFRYQPDEEDEPRFDRYEVPYRKDWVVLDALNHIKDEMDGTLSYRWSCRMGVCGSCGMMVNGEAKLTCATFLRDYYPEPIRIQPLDNFPVVRDLVINMDDFLHKLGAVQAWMIPKEERSVSEGEYRQSPAELARYKDFSMCINCMLCYSACPVYGRDQSFIGPAAIALAQRYNLDSRDGGAGDRAEVIFSHEGIWDCTFVGDCTRVCPKDVDPAGAIQQAKVDATKDLFLSVLVPHGTKETVSDKLSTETSKQRDMSNQSAALKSKEYVRPIPVTWWLKRKTYFLFMVRELTSLFVGGYALFLLVLLSQANNADAFAAMLNSPWSVGLHLVALLMVLYHSITWINLTPKVMVLWRGEDRVDPRWIAAGNYVAWVSLSILIFGICWKIAGT